MSKLSIVQAFTKLLEAFLMVKQAVVVKQQAYRSTSEYGIQVPMNRVRLTAHYGDSAGSSIE